MTERRRLRERLTWRWPSRPLSLCLLLSAALVSAWSPSVDAKQIAYVTDDALDIVSVIDTTTHAVTATVPLGPGLRPFGIAISHDGRTAVVTNAQTDSVSIVDLASHAISNISLHCVSAECRPEGVTFSPDDRIAYVVNHEYDAISVATIDMARREVTRTVRMETPGTGGYANVAVTGDGTFLYVTGPFRLFVIDTVANTVAGALSGDFFDVAVAPDGKTVYAAGVPTVSVIDAERKVVTDTIALDRDGSNIVVGPDGRRAYVTSGDSVLAIDTATHTIVDRTTLPPFTSPSDVAITPDGTSLLLADVETSALLVVDVTAGQVSRSAPLGHRPQGLAVTPDGATAYVANVDTNAAGGALLAADLRTGAVTPLFPPAGPAALAAAPDGTRIYVANALANEVAALDTATNKITGAAHVESPYGVATAGDGSRVYVSSAASTQTGVKTAIVAIDAESLNVVQTLAVDNLTTSVALSPTRNVLYAGVYDSSFGLRHAGALAAIDLATGVVINSVPVGEPIRDLAITPDGGSVYAATFLFFLNDIVGGVAVVDAGDLSLSTTIGGGGYLSVAVTPDGSLALAFVAYYLHPGGIDIIDTATRAVVATVPDVTGRIAIAPDGRFAYVVSGGRAVVLDIASRQPTATIPFGVSPSGVVIVGVPSGACACDCNQDKRVTVGEIVQAVNRALGNGSPSNCPMADTNGDGRVTVDDLMRGVDAALHGCPID